MCGRYVIAVKIEAIERMFEAIATENTLKSYKKTFNAAPGDFLPVIVGNKVEMFQFGLTPSWAKKRMYLFNARSEGDRNQENAPNYSGMKGIIAKPAFRKQIRSQRCLVPASCFIEGTTTEKLDKPYVVYVQNTNLFGMAGIWDEWTDTNTGEILHSFSIITTTANKLLQRLPHQRSPVIIPTEYYHKWLNPSTHLGTVTGLLYPYASELMNAYPISSDIKKKQNNSKEFIQPTGQRLQKEYDYHAKKFIELQGMGRSKRGAGDFTPWPKAEDILREEKKKNPDN